MKIKKTRNSWQAAAGAVAILFASSAVAADNPARIDGGRVTRVAPEVATVGITHQQYFDRQRELQTWLVAEMPDGTLNSGIRVRLNAQDRENLANPPATPPLRIGVVKSIRRQPNGVTAKTTDGGTFWATTITSPDASGIRLHFSNFNMGDGAEVYVFNTEGEAHGPYTGQGPNGNGDFWSNTVFSARAIVLVYEPGPANAVNPSFVIDRVGHIGRRFPAPILQGDTWSHDQCGNEDCVVDANCGNVSPADQSAIAKMEWIQGAFIFTCTGGLIADTDTSSQRNLFLSANHCLSKSRSNMETFFEYTTSSCNGSCPGSPAPHTTGMIVLKSGRRGDFTLMELSQNPPAGSTFLGWNNSAIAFTDGADLYRVSNPNFGPQVFSHHQVDTTTGTCQGWPRGERIYSADITGATDLGSSGSPVVNSAGEIVGQLSGCCGFGCEVCVGAPTNATVDGALAFYYNDVAEFLDPDSTPCDPSPEICDNNVDDDCDGDVDCDDADCSGDPACETGCTLGQKNDPCDTGADCCSGICKRNGTCR